jgi:GTP cyclohydrolase I
MTLKLPATTLVANCASAALFDATSAKVDRSALEAAFRTIICWTGDDPNRDGLIETPARMARALAEHFAGYAVDPAAILQKTCSEIAGYDETIVLAGIPFVSHCEHHMAPIVGRAWVGYTPRGRVVGISKLARVVDAFARRLQIQERMTAQIAGAIEEALQPEGVGVVLKAVHHCMSARGVHKSGVEMVTSRMLGSYRDDPETRKEFLRIATSTPAAQA